MAGQSAARNRQNCKGLNPKQLDQLVQILLPEGASVSDDV